MKVVPPEYDKQRVVLMSFPHKNSDWNSNNSQDLKDALSVFIRIAQAIAYHQAVYIICDNKETISSLFCSTRNMTFIEIETNDTWIRDYGYISIREDNETKLLNFNFDAWGEKFDYQLDNQVNQTLHQKGYMGIMPLIDINFVLEGGSIESDGLGTIMTTSKCLTQRNKGLSKKAIEEKLEAYLGAKRILWLDYGYLAGDDTDAHIDTLARFVSKDTIMYIECDDKTDEHYQELQKMKIQLQSFRTLEDKPYTLIALPWVKAKYHNKQRLPATYANFLITNKALIYPTYKDPSDKIAHQIFKDFFQDKEIIPISCLKLIQEGGSLHCSTMQISL